MVEISVSIILFQADYLLWITSSVFLTKQTKQHAMQNGDESAKQKKLFYVNPPTEKNILNNQGFH